MPIMGSFNLYHRHYLQHCHTRILLQTFKCENITSKPAVFVCPCSLLLLRGPWTVTGRSVDFNLLVEDMTTSLPAKCFHNRAQVRTGNHQRTVNVFYKWATVGVQGLASAGVWKWHKLPLQLSSELFFISSLWAADCQELFCDRVGCEMLSQFQPAHV